jgi:hypothetical protein
MERIVVDYSKRTHHISNIGLIVMGHTFNCTLPVESNVSMLNYKGEERDTFPEETMQEIADRLNMDLYGEE